MHRLRYQNQNDTFHNFNGNTYLPLISDLSDKLRSSNILINSAIDSKYKNMIDNIVDDVDENDRHLIWQIKNTNGKLWWELYFYDNIFPRSESISLANKYFEIPEFNQNIKNNFCWSIDINEQYKKNVTLFFPFGATPYESEKRYPGGFSYTYDGSRYEYRNTYYFWKNTISNLNHIEQFIKISPNYSKDIDINNLLITEFLDYYKETKLMMNMPHKGKVEYYGIIQSTKKYCDSIYYSQLNIDMLLIFLKKFNYPNNQIEFLELNKSKLNHLLFEVDISYGMKNNKHKIIKTGYYGQI